MKPKLYVETTIPSYLTSRPSRDLVKAARQEITHEWWERQREQYDLFVSEVVLEEAARGDPNAARRRLEAMTGLPSLELTPEARDLAEELMKSVPLPPAAALDSLHIAISATSGLHYLMTWNCTHIANAKLRAPIESICRRMDFEPPTICTPEELLGE